MWYVRNPARLRAEMDGIEILRDQAPWLRNMQPTLLPGMIFAVNFDLEVHGELNPFVISFPAFFPDSPPSVIPRDSRRHSSHQYGAGGELCLEYRADNWDPAVTGAMMIESAHRLLEGERPPVDAPVVVPSAHSVTEGQRLRGNSWRFLYTEGLRLLIGTMATRERRMATLRELNGPGQAWVANVSSVTAVGGDWHDPGMPVRDGRNENGAVFRVDHLIEIADYAALREFVAAATGAADAASDNGQSYFTILTDGDAVQVFFSFWYQETWRLIPYTVIDVSTAQMRLPASHAGIVGKKIGLVGCGSLGSKTAAMIARSGGRNFVLIDDDVLKPGNLVRNELDANALGLHKVAGLEARLRGIAPGVMVSGRPGLLGGQEASGFTASVMDELATCDLIIETTADGQAFNFAASVARSARIPFIWSEVYAGGIGGFVGRVRPDVDPTPHAGRRQYLAWCHNRAVPFRAQGEDYGAREGVDEPLIADDADVAVIAGHTSRMAIDTLVRGREHSIFPHSAYVIGLSKGWIFTEPFHIEPLDFSSEGSWEPAIPGDADPADVEYFVSLLRPVVNADRTGA